MDDQPIKAGLYASAAMHAALLGFLVFGFAFAPKFEDATESIPVDTITQNQFNEIMKGERDAKPMKEPPPAPPQRQAAADPQPTPPTPPTPPPDLKTADVPPPPPPTPPVQTPPPKPDPTPPPKPTAEESPAPAPSPPPRPKETPPPKPKVDTLAKILEKDKEDLAKPVKSNFDSKAIAKLISDTKSAPDSSPTGATARGLPTAHDARLSPSLAAAIDGWLRDAYYGCWTPPPTLPQGEQYVALVSVELNADGSLAATPQLVNPPSNPAWRADAESAVRAVLKCNPLHVPPEFAPYFQDWRAKRINFDPSPGTG